MKRFCGWVKQAGGEWRVVCRADTWGECWALLIRHRVKGAASCEKLVNGGSHPDARRRPR